MIADVTLNDVRIPRNLLADPDFGGQRDGDCQRGALQVQGGRVIGLAAGALSDRPRMVVPKLTEAHCHLDKCHTISRMGDIGGDLKAAIAAQARDKAQWTAADLAQRAKRGLVECAAAGCAAVRSHIDWGDDSAPPLGWQVLTELGHPDLNVQWAALTGIDQMADAGFAQSVAETIARTPGGVLGSFVLDHELDLAARGLANVFRQADRLGLALDFHVDETLGDFGGVERIADAALAVGFEGPLLLGHAVALMDKSSDDFARIADKLARAGATICALPTTNLYLQGRCPGTPDRRGLTRLRELEAAGVPIIVGSDNVADAFCPLGAHDPLAALHLACLAAHLDPPLARRLPMVTTDAARAIGLPTVTVDTAQVQQLLISEAPDSAGLISGRHVLRPLADLVSDHSQAGKVLT